MLDKIWRFLKQLIQRIFRIFGKDSNPPLTPPLVRGGDKKENISSSLSKGEEQNLASPLSKGEEQNLASPLSKGEEQNLASPLSKGEEQNLASPLSKGGQRGVLPTLTEKENLASPLSKGEEQNLASPLSKGEEQNLASPLSKGGLRGVLPTLTEKENLASPLSKGEEQNLASPLSKGEEQNLASPFSKGGQRGVLPTLTEKENLASPLSKGEEQNLASPLSKGGQRGVPPTLSDAEYESKLMQLLEGVNQGWGRGDVAEFLIAKRIKDGDLAAWLRRFGVRSLEGAQGSTEGGHAPSTAPTNAVVSLQELARRLELLGRVAGGELGEVAGNVGREILVEFPPVSGEGDEDVDGEAEAWFDRGYEQCMKGDFEGGLVSFDEALEFKPDYHKAWNGRGIALDDLGLLEEAIASYDKALEFKPDFHQAWHNRGNVLRNLGLLEGAIASYDKALEIKPDLHEAWHNRGVALRNLGLLEEAIASYDKALEFKPDKHEAWHNRGVALRNLGLLEEAIASYDKALEFKPDDHQTWYNRGNALRNLGLLEEAIASYDKALEFKPDKHEAWYNRGNVVKNAAKHRLLVYEILQTKFPKSPPVTRTLLTHNLTQRGYEGQVLTLQAGLEYCRQNTHPKGYGELHQALGNAHYSRGKLNSPYTYWNKATASYKEALKTLTPDAFLKLHLEVLQSLIKTLVSLKQTDEANKLRRDATDLLQRLLKQQNYAQLTQQQLTDKLVSFEQLTVNIFIQSGQFAQALATAETDKNVCLSWLLDALPTPDYATEETVTHAQIQQLLNPATAAIYWHLGDAALTAFIIKSDGLLSPETCFSDFPDEFEAWVKEWNQQYTDYQSKQKEGQQNHPWRGGMASKFARLKEILKIDVIEQQLEGITDLILIPHRDLHRFPIHALFSRDFVVSYLPSAAVGINLQQRFTGISRLSPSLDPPKSPLRRGTLNEQIPPSTSETLNTPVPPSQSETLNTLVPPFLRGVRGDQSIENPAEISHLPPSLDPPKSPLRRGTLNTPVPPSQSETLNTLVPPSQSETLNTPVPPSQSETLNTLVPPFLRGVRGDQSIENPAEISHLPPSLDPPKSPLRRGTLSTPIPPSQTETLKTPVPPLARGARGVLSILSIENPHSVITDKNGQPKRLAPLPAAEIESEIICRMFDNSTRLKEDAATLDEVERLWQQPHNIFHFTGHGSYNFDHPLESTLYLSNTHRLTVREIIKHNLSNYQLICLPACETALTDKQTILAEYVGLTSGFMRAGVGCVVSTLWPVESGASTLLMIYFYHRWREVGDSLPVALRNAQKWLQEATREDLATWYQGEIDKISANSPELSEVEFMLSRFFKRNRQALATMELDPPYQHPYYWAAFTITGL
ncbi:tetratricopeptide repeat protein [Microcoleus sp. EPA2]|uniref:CHAT domain-containing protein n=1 Tax=Microcoleus sp. EPA2 TaxID=2841654 RepID=UPI00312B58B5